MKKHPFLPAVLVLLVLTTTCVTAQRYLASIQGEVTDSTGAVVPNAEVTAEEIATHFKSAVRTNAGGIYTFASLNPGNYIVTTSVAGFRTESHSNIVLTAGALEKIDFHLSAGAATEVVNVTASDTTLLDSGSANIATTLSAKEVTDIPNVGRNPFVMATLAAGVINTGSGGYFQGKSSQFTNPFSGVAVQITTDGNGGHNRLTLNGIPDDPAERLSGASYTGFVPSPEAVEEVKVQTSIFDAQVGHGNGTVTNTVVRSGTNSYHGAAYYVFQNTYLNANTSEKVPNQNLTTSARTPRNNDQLSQTGFVLNGPVRIPKIYDGRNKTFFLVSFERYASHTAINYSARVPTQAERSGDFSALCSAFNSAGLCTSGIQIYNPNSPIDANGNRTQYYPNNNIASAINPAGNALLSYVPLPNVAGAAITATNYISTQTSYPSTYPSFIFRLDQAIGANNKLNATIFRSGLTQNYPLQGFPKGIGPTGYGYNVYRNNRGGSIDDVHQFSPSLVLDSRLGVLWHPFGLVYPGSQNFDLSSINTSGTGLPYASFPGIAFYNNATNTSSGNSDGYAGLAAGAGGQVSTNMTGALAEILTKTLGRHTLRFGFEGNLIRYNVQNPQSGFGAFGFDRRFTQRNYATGDGASGDPVASLLLGYHSTATYNIQAAYALQQIYTAPFVQDDWRFNDKLTLNLGVRWDYESPFTERYNKQVTSFCTGCTNPLQASVPGLALNGGLQFTSPSNRYPYPSDFNNWQPRIGAAYQATPNTVVRGGFGIIYFNTLESPIGTGFSQTTSYTNTNLNLPLYTIGNSFPSGVTLPTGSSLGLATGLGQNISFVDPNHVQPKSAQWSASVQQQLPGNLALQVAYVGARPTRLEVNHNINALPVAYLNQGLAGQTSLNTQVANPMAGKFPGTSAFNSANIARAQLLVPYPEFGTVTAQYSSIGSAPYNALQVQVQRPMRNHFSLQGNFTWSKTMLRNGFFNSGNYVVAPHLYSVQDPNATIVANIFGTVQLPQFASMNHFERLLIGGWQLNSVFRAQNGNLITAPTNADIIGDPHVANPTYSRFFNTCYQTPAGVNVLSTSSAPACDSATSTPAFRQRYTYDVQQSSNYLNVRQRIHPLVDLSLFKQFQIHEGTSFEIRGEFFNVLNTPNFGSPNNGVGSATFGSVPVTTVNGSPYFTQANDARIGQLTARINF